MLVVDGLGEGLTSWLQALGFCVRLGRYCSPNNKRSLVRSQNLAGFSLRSKGNFVLLVLNASIHRFLQGSTTLSPLLSLIAFNGKDSNIEGVLCFFVKLYMTPQ